MGRHLLVLNSIRFLVSDFQKLEREARICRKLQHPNIGEYCECTFFLSYLLIAYFFLMYILTYLLSYVLSFLCTFFLMYFLSYVLTYYFLSFFLMYLLTYYFLSYVLTHSLTHSLNYLLTYSLPYLCHYMLANIFRRTVCSTDEYTQHFCKQEGTVLFIKPFGKLCAMPLSY